jgi:uncharacterized membrane protein YdbT with pleckstrin-like domain
MSYVHQHLMEDEEVVYQTHVHWIVFIPWFLITILILSAMFFVPDTPMIIAAIRVVAGLFFMKATATLIFYWTSEYGVTSKRVLGKTGLIRIRSLDILLLKVEAVRLDQGILGRMLDFGDLIVTGTGGTTETLYDVPSPLMVRNLIQEQASRNYSDAAQHGHGEG